MDSQVELWSQVSELLKNEPDMTEFSYRTWIHPIEPLSFTDNKLVLVVPNDLSLNMFDKKYAMYVQNALRVLFPARNISVEYITKNDISKYSTTTQTAAAANPMGIMLNPAYTFETYVTGTGNSFAHAACLAVAEAPAKETNPLFIYGGSGLGKTHLLHAIGNYILSQNASTRVLYVSFDKFRNDLIAAIQNKQNAEFRYKYRNVDVLMIDDIQFIAGQEATQEEMFHTFNDLYSSGRQIIISSDKPPREIPKLEERVRTRFEWGLIADIQPPDYETRIAILNKKAEYDGASIDSQAIEFIATKVEGNIRELEGLLNRVLLYATLSGKTITLDLTQEALKDFFPANEKKINARVIMDVVSRYYNLKTEDLSAKRRDKTVALARQIAMFFSRELTDLSLPLIGEEFGGRDHSTVIHAINKVSQLTAEDTDFKNELTDLRKRILGI